MNHIELTIQALSAQIAECQDCIRMLHKLTAPSEAVNLWPTAPIPLQVEGDSAPSDAPNCARKPRRPGAPRSVPRGTAKQAVKAPERQTLAGKTGSRQAYGPRGQNPMIAQLTTVTAGLAEPFSARDLAHAAHTDTKTASNFLGRQRAKKWFHLVRRGQYARGPGFPKMVGGTPPIPMPASSPNPSPRPRAAADERPDSNEAVAATSAAGIKIGESLRSPFTRLDVEARLDGSSARAGQWLAEWLRAKWILQIGGNTFRHTQEFGV